MSTNKKAGIVLMAMGLFTLMVGLSSLTSSINFAANYTPTTGQLINYKINKYPYQDHGETAITYAPIIKFKTRDNHLITFKSDHLEDDKKPYPIGHLFKILYNPKNPHSVTFDSFSDLWATPIMCAFFTPILLFLGLLIFRNKSLSQYINYVVIKPSIFNK